MFTAPTKPVDQMTEEERRQFESWLLDEGRNPREIVVDRLSSGSEFNYDYELQAVVETTVTGARHLVALRDGRIARMRFLPSAGNTQSTNSSQARQQDPGPLFAFAILAIIAIAIIWGQGIGPAASTPDQVEWM